MTIVELGGLGGVVARVLRVRAPERNGVLVLGADRVGLALATELRRRGRDVTLLDANPDRCREAEVSGWPVVFGNALEERTLAALGWVRAESAPTPATVSATWAKGEVAGGL